jgi:ribosomal protein L32E
VTAGREIPGVSSVLTDETIGFAISVIDSTGVPQRIEDLLRSTTGRPRTLKVRALLVALLLLAIDDRPLHLKAATRLLYCRLSSSWREQLGVKGSAETKKSFLARYRQVRYLFHLAVSVIDPSVEVKNRVISKAQLDSMRKKLSAAEIAIRTKRLEAVMADLVEASVKVCDSSELEAFCGSVGLDATVMPLFSRGPSSRSGTSASDPDGGWYVREGDHRETTGPSGKKLRKLYWALEATIVTMGRRPMTVPAHPNLVLAVGLGRPGEDPGGSAVRLLASVRERGYPAGHLGADRGYTQVLAERFHLPVRALSYSLVMDYRTDQLGYQANSQGAVLVDGTFYCPAMPQTLVSASADARNGVISEQTRKARISARVPWRLVRKQGPDKDGYERFGCPAQGPRPHLCCPLRPASTQNGIGQIPVLSPPSGPPKICTQSAVTIAPDVGARHRQDLSFGSAEWQQTYAVYRNTIEGLNGYLKDPAHECLQASGRRRVRGIAAQSLFTALLVMAVNFRKIQAHRQLTQDGSGHKVLERAKRRRTSLEDYKPPPSV